MNKTAEYYEKACEEARNHVIKLARQVLRKNKSLVSFTMAMGTYFFQDKEGNIIDCHTSYYTPTGYRWVVSKKSFTKLVDFICEWDDYLKITGDAAHFTSTGPVITDW